MSNGHAQAKALPLDSGYTTSIFEEIGNYERHYNTMQTVYRNMASTWLLGALVASGIVMQSQKDTQFLINQWSIEVLLGMFGAVGIAMLWLLDLQVYHRLLLQVYRIGEQVEKEYGLPPIRSTAPTLNVRTFVAAFYGAVYTAMLMVVALGLIRRPFSTGWDWWQDAGLGGAVLLVVGGVVMFCYTKKREDQPIEDIEDALDRYLKRMLRTIDVCKSTTEAERADIRKRLLLRCQNALAAQSK